MIKTKYIKVGEVLPILKKYNLVKSIKKENKYELKVELNDTHQLYALGMGYEIWMGNIKENEIIISNAFYSMKRWTSYNNVRLWKKRLPDILIGSFLAKPYFFYEKQPEQCSDLLRLKILIPVKEITLYISPK